MKAKILKHSEVRIHEWYNTDEFLPPSKMTVQTKLVDRYGTETLYRLRKDEWYYWHDDNRYYDDLPDQWVFTGQIPTSEWEKQEMLRQHEVSEKFNKQVKEKRMEDYMDDIEKACLDLKNTFQKVFNIDSHMQYVTCCYCQRSFKPIIHKRTIQNLYCCYCKHKLLINTMHGKLFVSDGEKE